MVAEHRYSTMDSYCALEPAVFVKKLSDHCVEPGKSIILESRYTGSLPISVTWKKNGVTLSQSEKCSITTTERSCILEILNSTTDDQGEYICMVENEAGEDICEALVSALGLSSLVIFSVSFKFIVPRLRCSCFNAEIDSLCSQNHLLLSHTWDLLRYQLETIQLCNVKLLERQKSQYLGTKEIQN